MWRSTSIQRSHYNTLRIAVYCQDSLIEERNRHESMPLGVADQLRR